MRKILKIAAGVVVAIIALVVIINVAGGHSTSPSAASSASASSAPAAPAPTTASPVVTQAPATAPAPAPSTTAPDTVTYVVSGGATADVSYGPAGSNITGTVPMSVTAVIPASPPSYYAITAQLQGSGTVSCKLEVNGKVISSGSATGGYNIATCEISQDVLSGGWQDTNS